MTVSQIKSISEPETEVDRAEAEADSSSLIFDRDILSLPEVALILRCTEDTARRIPRSELGVYLGPGRARLYLRDDIKHYLRQRRIR